MHPINYGLAQRAVLSGMKTGRRKRLLREEEHVVTMIRQPDFFIVGAPKCGTTALGQFLGSHPDVFMARKEMHHFGSDLRFGPQFYRRDLAAYLSEFAAAGRRQAIAGEASVWYLASTSAARELKAFNPDSRIIIMLREPSETMYSMFSQFRFDGNEHLFSFEEALAAEPERHAGRMISRETYLAQGLCYRHSVRFVDQISRFLEIFGRDRVHVILHEDMAATPGAVGRDVFEFLGVDPRRGGRRLTKFNEAKVVRSRSMRLLQHNARLRSFVLACRPFFPPVLFSLLQKADAGMRTLNSTPRRRPAMDSVLRRQLRAEFAPEVERLGRLLDRDLAHWTTGESRPAQTDGATVNAKPVRAPKPVGAALRSPA